MHTRGFITFLDKTGVEESLRGKETRSINGDRLSIGYDVVLAKFSALSGLLLIGSEVKRYETDIFLDLSNNLFPSRGTTLLSNTVSGKELAHMISNSSTSDEILADGVGDLETFINRNCVGYTITRVANETSCSSI